MDASEKEILLNWQRCKIDRDVVDSLQRSRFIMAPDEAFDNYFHAVEQLKKIRDKRIAALVEEAYEERPVCELTVKDYKKWKKWKARTDAAQDRLLTASFDLDSNIS